MNRYFLAIALCCATVWAAQAQSKSSITLKVGNVRNAKGYVLLSLYTGEEGFPSKTAKAIKTLKVRAVAPAVAATFTDVPPGEYAVSLMHDEDDDGKMATNMIGIPKEGYATSNNAKGTLGPPKYADAKFVLGAAPLVLNVQMNY